MSKLPTVEKKISMSPHLEEFVEGLLEPLTGKDLTRAQEIVRHVYAIKEPAQSAGWRKRYEDALREAGLLKA